MTRTTKKSAREQWLLLLVATLLAFVFLLLLWGLLTRFIHAAPTAQNIILGVVAVIDAGLVIAALRLRRTLRLRPTEEPVWPRENR